MSKSNRHKRRCFWCHVRDCPLTNDHIVPLGFGGTDHDDNIRRACNGCNQERGRIVNAALVVFRSAVSNHSERAQRSARVYWESLATLVAKWREIESLRLGGRSVSDKLGGAECPFPAAVVPKRAGYYDDLKAARKRADNNLSS